MTLSLNPDDYLVHDPNRGTLDHITPRWRRAYPMFAVEIALAYTAAGWAVVGLWSRWFNPTAPAGSAFEAAAKATGSSRGALTALLIAAALVQIIGMIIEHRRMRRIGILMSGLSFGFIAAGLSTRGVLSTAVVVYPALAVLAFVTYLTIPEARDDR